jgi:hypothetical protein
LSGGDAASGDHERGIKVGLAISGRKWEPCGVRRGEKMARLGHRFGGTIRIKWPAVGLALGAAGVSVAAAAIPAALGAIELARAAHADIWSNALVIVSIVVVGIGLLIAVVYFVAGCVDFERRGEPAASPAHPVAESAERGTTIETPDS